MEKSWEKLLLPQTDDGLIWELFHENSKESRYHHGLSEEEIFKKMEELHEALIYTGYPIVELPPPDCSQNIPLYTALSARRSIRKFIPGIIDLREISTILHFAYGPSLEKAKAETLRPLRMVPSGGGLYPLEIYIHSTHLKDQKPGIYHYNPTQHHLRLLKAGDLSLEINSAFVQPDLTNNALVTIFISAVFERNIFKYGNRGYRYILLEAGHLAQNINLVAQALKLGCLNIGGFFDRQIDSLFDFDGLTQSTIYIAAVGNPPNKAQRVP